MVPGSYDDYTKRIMQHCLQDRLAQYRQEARHSELVAIAKQARRDRARSKQSLQQRLGLILIQWGQQLAGETSLSVTKSNN